MIKWMGWLAFLCSMPALAALPVDELQVPPGFAVSVFSDQVPAARALAVGENGTVFAGSMGAGKVYALTPDADNKKATHVRVIASGLQMPAGIALHEGDLYVSAVSRIYVLRDIENHLDQPPEPELITDALPDATHHGWRFIAFGPDERLYVPIGAPCNVCERDGYALLASIRQDGSDFRIEARGIRNTVGFDWQPDTDKLWFTDNGRDLMGDDIPGDELNRIDHPGKEHFGFPYCHQGDTPDPELGKGHDCSDYSPPAHVLDPHVAALGMRFYRGAQFPSDYRGDILIAEHGSWNRSEKIGYRVMRAHVDGDRVEKVEPLISGFLHDESAWGRPVDVQELADGSLLIADDHAGAIYRLTYTAPD